MISTQKNVVRTKRVLRVILIALITMLVAMMLLRVGLEITGHGQGSYSGKGYSSDSHTRG